ncbi:amid-like nadh [Moniliophthora roreri MCA 2997]|uniref:Amid-like nadh n=2 Tax=Moniliophthora roreri TaxID=221103 RepID=V2XXH5_MONRO|nr:amid-like nadh [Moniliophthora roreri MCA 2997]KAI3611905.1 amid-like nadh [Moniliophthora roreri]
MVNGKPNVVVLGGSYVGIKAVDLLAPIVHKTHDVVLIEKNTHFQHLFAFPRASVVPGFEHKAFIPYTSSFFREADAGITDLSDNVTLPSSAAKIVHGVAKAIRPAYVLLENGEQVQYDYLVLATGTGARGPLTSIDKKTGISTYRNLQGKAARARHIVVVGGGAYGIQLATDTKTFGHTQGKRVTIVHSRDRLMNRFGPSLHDIVMDRCKELGIDVVLNNRVIVPPTGFPEGQGSFDVQLSGGGSMEADLVYLCTGAVPLSAPLESLSPDAIDPQTKFVKVKPTMQIDGESSTPYPNVFAIGDVADTGAHKAARPGVAQAQVVATNIEKLMRASSKQSAHANGYVNGHINGHANGHVYGHANGDAMHDLKLEEYVPDAPGIHMSLGMKGGVIFKHQRPLDSGGEEPAPIIKWDQEENLEMGCGRMWKMRAQGVDDFFA